MWFFFFRENLYRVNVTDHKNGSQTFNEMKIQSFDYEASNGSETDVIVAPDIPYIVSLGFVLEVLIIII